MNLAHNPTRLWVTGVSGYGKTLFWSRFVLGWPARFRFVFDHDGQFCARYGIRPARTREGLIAASESGWCVFDPSRMFPGRLGEAFDFFAQFAFEFAKAVPGRKLFATDEIQGFVPSLRLPPGFASVLQTGRVHGLDSAFIGIAANRIHPELRNQASEVVAFHTKGGPALDVLSKEWDFNAAELRSLPKFAFVARAAGGGETRGSVRL